MSEEEWDEEATAIWHDGPALTDVPFSPPVAVHSPRLKDLLLGLGLGAEVQYLPIRIVVANSGAVAATHFVPNYLLCIPCLDLERSEYHVYGPDWILPNMRGQVHGVWRAVLKAQAIGDAPVFRIAEYSQIAVIRQDVKEAIEAARMTGPKFGEVELANEP